MISIGKTLLNEEQQKVIISALIEYSKKMQRGISTENKSEHNFRCTDQLKTIEDVAKIIFERKKKKREEAERGGFW